MKREPPEYAVESSQPRFAVVGDTIAGFLLPSAQQSGKIFGMDRGLPTRALGLISRQAGVLLPPPINEIYGALWNTRPHKRRNSIDNRSEFAEGLPNLTRHRFARFSSVHRATNLDSRTMQHASETIHLVGEVNRMTSSMVKPSLGRICA